MSNLTAALQELREERKQAQKQVEKFDQAIFAIESLNGSGTSVKGTTRTRVISPAARRKMALAQRARWDRARKELTPPAGRAKTVVTAPKKRTMSVAARKRIAAAQKARWAKVRSGEKKTG
jgi:hypothetical protein